MATRKSIAKKKAAVKKAAAPKLTHTQASRLMRKHFPKVKAAAEKALRDAGVHGVDVDHMMFRADLAEGSDPCGGACGPDQTCMLGSNGEFSCV